MSSGDPQRDRTYPGYPSGWRWYLRECKTAFHAVRRGASVTTHWSNPPLDLDGWRAEFASVTDRRINLRGGMTGDGARRKLKCGCHSCSRRCCCRRCLSQPSAHVEFGGRKWGDSWQIDMARDARAIRDASAHRVRVYQFCTEEARARFGHLLAARGD